MSRVNHNGKNINLSFPQIKLFLKKIKMLIFLENVEWLNYLYHFVEFPDVIEKFNLHLEKKTRCFLNVFQMTSFTEKF